jgi:DNA polymerase-1
MQRNELLALCDCFNCPLQDKHVPVFGTGPAGARLAIVGEAPSYNDVSAGEPFAGQSGNLLNATLGSAGLSRKDLFLTNVVACRPQDSGGKDTGPNQLAIKCCSKRLKAEIDQCDPDLVLAFGNTAAQHLLETKDNIGTIQGTLSWNEDLQTWILPTYHPAVVLHGNVGVFDDILGAVKRSAKMLAGALPFPNRDEVLEYEYITDNREAEKVWSELAALSQRVRIAIDIETDGVDSSQDALLLVAISSDKRTYVFEASTLYEFPTKDLMAHAFENPYITWVWHNASFDLQFMKREFGFGTSRGTTLDTMCLALGLTERGEAVGLKRLAREYLNVAFYEKELAQYLPTKKTPFSAVPRPVLAKYAAQDVVNTIRMLPILEELTKEEKTYDLATGLLLDAQFAFADMEAHGVLIDQSYVATVREEWQPRIDAAEQAMIDFAQGHGFKASDYVKDTKNEKLNVRSPKQVGGLLYDVLGLPLVGGTRTTGADFVEKYPDHEWTKLKEHFTMADHMMRTYVNGIVDDIKNDGRVHPDFLLFGTRTGRLAIHNPPLQTIPRGDLLEDEKTGVKKFGSIKKLFMATPAWHPTNRYGVDMMFVEADYKTLELCVGAMLSGDPVMRDQLNGGDFHRQTASKIFGIPESEVTERQRYMTKFVTFGLMYGRQAYSIAMDPDSGIGSMEEAQSYIDGFFAALPVYFEYWKNVQVEALDTGRLVTPFGRVRRWNLITPQMEQAVRNQACNFPLQSTASDITLRALCRLNTELQEREYGHVLFTVHDSIEYEVRKDRLDEACQLINDVMSAPPPFETDVNLVVDISVGPSWGDTEKWSAGY